MYQDPGFPTIKSCRSSYSLHLLVISIMWLTGGSILIHQWVGSVERNRQMIPIHLMYGSTLRNTASKSTSETKSEVNKLTKGNLSLMYETNKERQCL